MSTDPTGSRPSPDASGAPAAQAASGRRDPEQHADEDRGSTRRGPQHAASAKPQRASRRSSRRSRKVRRVHRVVRHFDVWSVAKVATIFAVCAYLVGMVSGYLLWQAADRVGTIEGIEGFFEDAGGYDTFELFGDVVFRVAAVAGLLLAGLTVVVVVIAAILFNLISDLTGGIRLTVIDEDLIVAPARRRPEPAPAGDRAGSGPPPSRAERPADPEPTREHAPITATGSPATTTADTTVASKADR